MFNSALKSTKSKQNLLRECCGPMDGIACVTKRLVFETFGSCIGSMDSVYYSKMLRAACYKHDRCLQDLVCFVPFASTTSVGEIKDMAEV